MSDTQELVYQLAKRVQGEIRFDKLSRLLYSTDASIYQIMPVGVVVPRCTEDVIAALKLLPETSGLFSSGKQDANQR